MNKDLKVRKIKTLNKGGYIMKNKYNKTEVYKLTDSILSKFK